MGEQSRIFFVPVFALHEPLNESIKLNLHMDHFVLFKTRPKRGGLGENYRKIYPDFIMFMIFHEKISIIKRTRYFIKHGTMFFFRCLFLFFENHE